MKTFGELTKQEKLDLFEAWLDEGTIQFNRIDGWQDIKLPGWLPEMYYRIKPTKPSINWDHVSNNLNYLIRDENRYLLCKNKPKLDGLIWKNYRFYSPASVFKSFVPGTCEPEDSLVIRPGYKEPSE